MVRKHTHSHVHSHHHSKEMDTTAQSEQPIAQVPQPTPKSPLGKMIMHPPMKVVLGLVGLAIVILLVGIVAIGNKKTPSATNSVTLQEALTTKGRFPQDEKIAQVGAETIYGKDLNFYLYSANSAMFLSKNLTDEQLKSTALSALTNNSILLQAGSKLKLVTLTPDIFNNVDKNQAKRLKAITSTTKSLRAREEKLSGSVISIWYFDQKAPKLPLDQAKALAKKKIDALYTDLKSGKITMKQAGETIKSDLTMSNLDANYQANAYYEFNNLNPDQITSFPEAQKALLLMKPNEISTVLLLQDQVNGKASDRQELYTIMQLTSRTNSNAGSFEDWLQNERKNYAVTIY